MTRNGTKQIVSLDLKGMELSGEAATYDSEECRRFRPKVVPAPLGWL